jgi:hypothetical protein
VSLPIRIFEGRSLIERVGDWFGFGPIYFKRAGQISDHLERFKLVVTFAVASLYTTIQMRKPFNPLLGETFQSYFEDGTRFFCEHSSHHPPVGHFLMEDPEDLYKVWGHYEFKAKISSNGLLLRTEGPNYVRFPDGQTV